MRSLLPPPLLVLALLCKLNAQTPNFITVTTLTDENDSPASSGDGISLREAITSSSNGDTITFASSLSGNTITLTLGQLLIDKSLTIDASILPAGLTIDANQQSRVMFIESETAVVLENLTLTGGKARNGLDGVEDSDDDLSSLGEDGEDGGGILIDQNSMLTLNFSTICHNQAGVGGNGSEGGFGGGGGGIAVNDHSTLILNFSAISHNRAGNGGFGGFGNGGFGGGISTRENAIITLNSSSLSHNQAGNGGSSVNNSTGSYGGSGGGIGSNENTIITLNSSSLTHNSSGNGGDGVGNGGDGGGISAFGSTIILNSSTLSHNRTGDGIGNGGRGAGISTMFTNTLVTLNSSTLTRNQTGFNAEGVRREGGGIFILDSPVPLTLQNSIVAANIGAGEDIIGGNRTLIEANLISGTPMLAPLGDYGGPTMTMPPLPGSPALNTGSSNDPGGTDQRGLARFVGGALDIGAVEVQTGETISPFPFPVTEFQDDADQDGIANGVEFIIGTDPFVADRHNTRHPSFSFGENGVSSLSFGRNIDPPTGVMLRVMRSTDLSPNSFTEVGVYESTSNGEPTTNSNDPFTFDFNENEFIFTDNSSPSASRAFYRLEAEYVAPN